MEGQLRGAANASTANFFNKKAGFVSRVDTGLRKPGVTAMTLTPVGMTAWRLRTRAL